MIPVPGYEGRRVAVFGLGRSGITAARALQAGGAVPILWDDGVSGRMQADVIAFSDTSQQEQHPEYFQKLSADNFPGWDDVPKLVAGARLLVNTTSLGMTGQPPLEIDLVSMHGSAVVADLVYAPLDTGLLAAARKRGLRTADGLGMLLHQAVRGFALWFGVRPAVTPELRAMVEADLVK